MEKVRIGMIGSGFASRLHGNSFRRVGGIEVVLRGTADISADAAKQLAEEYGYEYWTTDYHELLKDPEIDAVILCTPPRLHAEMLCEALKAGKHVLCEKPLTGYFGKEGDPELPGLHVPKKEMLKKVCLDMERLEEVVNQSRCIFMYAENYIYTPAIQRAAEFVRAKKSIITYLRGEESVQGSPSAGAGYWKNIGGGTLLRIGCHPLGGMLYLKREQARARGEDFGIHSLVADTGMVNPGIPEAERKYLNAKPQDVEDFGTVTITFTDGTKATVFANDNVVGGIRNYIDIYCNDATLHCHITPTDDLETYFVDDDGLENVYMSEKLEQKTGWNSVFVSESIKRGYVAQLQDFLECVAYNRQPLSGFSLARMTGELIYAAYVSAEEGRRVFWEEVQSL